MSYARQETGRKTDLRVVKTRRSLDGAMKSLLSEKDFDSITVKEICDRAQTRKATFYNHFSDKDELLAYVVRLQMEASEREGVVADDPDDPTAYYCSVLDYLMQFMNENEPMFRQTVRGGGHAASFLYKEETQAVFRERFRKEFEDGNASVRLPDMLADIVAEMVVQCAEYWFMHKDRVSREETARQFKALVEPIFVV